MFKGEVDLQVMFHYSLVLKLLDVEQELTVKKKKNNNLSVSGFIMQ